MHVNVNVNIKIVLTYMLRFNWCHLYLLDRKEVILLDCESREARQARNEVPRGSILGPLFFIIFTSDLTLLVNCQVTTIYLIYSRHNSYSLCGRQQCSER